MFSFHSHIIFSLLGVKWNRRALYCPLQTCKSKKPILKLSNHLVQVHKITDPERRAELIRKSRSSQKIVENIPSNQPKITDKLSQNKFLVNPTLPTKKGSTRNFPHYKPETPQIAKLHQTLISFDGGSKSTQQAKQITTDISKFLAFADSTKFDWNCLSSYKTIREYIKKLEEYEVGPDGILSKLDNFQLVIKYCIREVKDFPHDAGKDAIDRIGTWKSTFRTKKTATMHARVMRSADSTSLDKQLEGVKNVLSSKLMQDHIISLAKTPVLSNELFDELGSYLFMKLTYGNMQRAGVALNLTVEEATMAREVQDDETGVSFLKLFVKVHKTSNTHGPAVIYLDDVGKIAFEAFLNARMRMSPELFEPFMVHFSGTTYDKNYMRGISKLLNKMGFNGQIPNLTELRKAGATKARDCLTDGQMESVSKHMTHSSTTSEQYYRDTHSSKRSLEAFKLIKNVTTKTTTVDEPLSFGGCVYEYFSKRNMKATLAECREFLKEYKFDKKAKQVQDKVRNFAKMNM